MKQALFLNLFEAGHKTTNFASQSLAYWYIFLLANYFPNEKHIDLYGEGA